MSTIITGHRYALRRAACEAGSHTGRSGVISPDLRATRWSKKNYKTCAVIPTVDARQGPITVLRTTITSDITFLEPQDRIWHYARHVGSHVYNFERNSGTTSPTQQWKYMHTRFDHDTSCINVVVQYRCFLSVPFATLLGLINRMNMYEVTRLTVWGK